MDEFYDSSTTIEPASSATNADHDPAAEFLTGQLNEIRDLENGVQSANSPDNQTSEQPFEAGEDFVLVSHDPASNFVSNAGDEGFEPLDPSQAYAAIAAADARLEQLRAEPEKIRLWREEHTKYLNEKDNESHRAQQEWTSQACKDFEDWNRNRLEQLEKTKESNRIAEKEFIKERDNPAPGSEWDQVSKLCNFNPTVGKGTKDLTRMRSTLLHLKQNPRPVTVSI